MKSFYTTALALLALAGSTMAFVPVGLPLAGTTSAFAPAGEYIY
jgi:hypothetical protein